MRAGGAVGEAIVVAAAVTVVVGVTVGRPFGTVVDPILAAQVITLVAAAVAAAAALLGAVAARLTGDPRPRWIAAALATYAVVILPATAIAVGPEADLVLRSLRLVAYVVTGLMLLAVIRPPARFGTRGTWAAAVTGALLTGGGAAVAVVAPQVARAVVTGPVPVVVLGGWATVAVAVFVDALLHGDEPRRRVGAGVVVMAGSQLYRRLSTGAPTELLFESLRLLGLAVVVVGLGQLVTRALADLRTEQFVQQEELALAALHMEKAGELAAERDHELRNGLAGLAGITHLLSSPVAGAEQERLRHAVLAELTRLHTLLDPDPPDNPDPAPSYLVAPVLHGLVALRRTNGAAVALHVEPGLRARGDSAVLAQVVTNLLANCDRHAPGAPFTIRADAGGRPGGDPHPRHRARPAPGPRGVGAAPGGAQRRRGRLRAGPVDQPPARRPRGRLAACHH